MANQTEAVRIRARSMGVGQLDTVEVDGDLTSPQNAKAVILFAHGSGSGRLSSRNQFVARLLRSNIPVGTLLIDLLTKEEEAVDNQTRHLRFNINLLAQRLVDVIDWMTKDERTRHLAVGLYGASTGAAAALVAAVHRSQSVRAVISRGGRPDLAGEALAEVKAPTLLVVGGHDYGVIELNEQSLRKLNNCPSAELKIVPGATHLFEEPGTLEQAASLSIAWFKTHLCDGGSGVPSDARGNKNEFMGGDPQ